MWPLNPDATCFRNTDTNQLAPATFVGYQKIDGPGLQQVFELWTAQWIVHKLLTMLLQP